MIKEKILISFVGTNDSLFLTENKSGAILNALANDKFDKVILLWNEAKINGIKFSEVVLAIKRKIIKEKLAKSIIDQEFVFKDVTDHNEIYPKLKYYTDTLPKNNTIKYTAAISSGTPSMQVCWILLAESGDFDIYNPLNLIKVSDPKFGKSKNINVKFSTLLPKIISLSEENENLKVELIPPIKINRKKAKICIGEKEINFGPMEFVYYLYFAERNKNGKSLEKFSGITTNQSFTKSIYNLHKDIFPELDLLRHDLEKMIKSQMEISIDTFRGNISKINKKIRGKVNSEIISSYYFIESEGIRGAKYYGIKCNENNLIFV